MQTKISAKTVDKMKPGDAISDTEIRGFSARRWDTGAVTYSLRYRTARGDRKRILIGTHGNVTPDEARKIAKQRAGEVAGGHDPALKAAATGKTVAAIWDDYARRELPKKRSAEAQRRAFDRLVRPIIGAHSIYSLRRSDMTKLFGGIADRNGRVMADRMLAYLGKAFRWHQVRDDDFTSPIVSGMTRTTTKELARDRTLNDGEISTLWQATDKGQFGALIRFLLLTAARRTEANAMTWRELDGSTWTLPASRNKTKVELVRPLSKAAMSIVNAQSRDSIYVFGVTGKPMGGLDSRKRLLDKVVSITGRWTLHDLRRTARSLMSRAGVSSDVAEMCLGHVLTGVRSTYDRHAYQSERAEAFERLADEVAKIVGTQ
jgi:integrase